MVRFMVAKLLEGSPTVLKTTLTRHEARVQFTV